MTIQHYCKSPYSDKGILLTTCVSRFLRARRFDPVKAQKQFADAEAWRVKHNVDELYSTFPVDELEDSRRFYPRWTGRRDKVSLDIDLCAVILIFTEWSSRLRVSHGCSGWALTKGAE